MSDFVGRRFELTRLEERFESLERLSVVLISGRRRIGKTALIRRFLKDKPAFYFEAVRTTFSLNLRDLVEGFVAFARSAGVEVPPQPVPADQRFLAFVWKKTVERFERQGKTFVVALDEFPRLLPESGFWTESDRREHVPMDSFLQRLIDENLDQRRHMIVLAGSSASVMRRIFFSGGAPLYGRASMHLALRGLSVQEVGEFFGLNLALKTDRRFAGEVATIFGGVPYYLRLLKETLAERSVSGRLDLALRRLLVEDLVLQQETDLVFQDEPGATEILKALVQALARKREALPEVLSELTGVSNVSPYLSVLRLADVAEPVPLLRSPSARARKKVPWRICDPFLRVLGRTAPVLRAGGFFEGGAFQAIMKRVRDAQGENYEVLCQRALSSVLAPTGIAFGRFLLHLPAERQTLEYDGVGFRVEEKRAYTVLVVESKLRFARSDWASLERKVRVLLERWPAAPGFKVIVFSLESAAPPRAFPWPVVRFDLPAEAELAERLFPQFAVEPEEDLFLPPEP